jgi:hypothetical protein
MEMTISHALDVIQNIEAPEVDDCEIEEAIDRLLSLATYNSVPKDTILKACRWLRNRCQPCGPWISVKDRLPRDCERVLVRVKRGDHVTMEVITYLDEEKENFWGGNFKRYIAITHWAAFRPEPPEVVSG